MKESGTIQEAADREASAAEEKTKAKAEAKADEPEAKTEEASSTENKDKGLLGKIRRLCGEGKIMEALEAVGIPIDKVDPSTKTWKAVKHQVIKAREEAASAKALAADHVAQAQRALHQVLPFVDGAQAYLKGDYATFLQLTTGDTPEAFQRKLIAQLHENPQQADTLARQEIDALKRERAQERQAWQAEQERIAQENSQLRYRQAQQEWVNEISTELKADPQYAKVASKPVFLQRVFALQQHYYNPKTQDTIATSEAAEMVWAELYGDVVGPTTATPQTKGASTQSSAVKDGTAPEHPGTGGANRTTTLRQTATEAAPEASAEWSRDNQEKILERYSRMARSEQLARNA